MKRLGYSEAQQCLWHGLSDTVKEAWDAALAADPISAFGGIVVTNRQVDAEAAKAINEIFFEVIIAPDYSQDALNILFQKKNRIILKQKITGKGGKQYTGPFCIKRIPGTG
jgi:AICAR transformylase/IMP cyclohydrolase PurH (only IMP cyclohydrolase domain in Aful)